MELPLLPEEETIPVFLSLEIPSVDLLDPEKERLQDLGSILLNMDK